MSKDKLLFTMGHPKKWMRENEGESALYIYEVIDPEIYETDAAVYVARTKRPWGEGFYDWDYDLGLLMTEIASSWER